MLHGAIDVTRSGLAPSLFRPELHAGQDAENTLGHELCGQVSERDGEKRFRNCYGRTGLHSESPHLGGVPGAHAPGFRIGDAAVFRGRDVLKQRDPRASSHE